MALEFSKIIEQHRGKLFGLAAAIAVYALLGFFLAPWLMKKNAIDAVDSMFGAELRIEKVAVNPFVLSLRIDRLEMDDPDGEAFFRFEQFYANLQLSSIINRAPTFAEIRFDAPEIFVSRYADGEMNLAFLLEGGDDAPATSNDAEESAMPRLVLHQFQVNEANAHWYDEVPRDPVETVFGPVNVSINDLSTLPQHEGQQDVVITTETTGTFSWSGSLQLNPLRSVGHAAVDGSHFPLISAYIKENSGFEVVRGEAGVGFNYAIDTRDDGEIEVRVDDFDLAFTDVSLRTFGRIAGDGSSADRSVIDIPTLRVDGGSLRYPEQEVSIGHVSIEDSSLEIYRDENGDLAVMHRSGESGDESADDKATSADAPWDISFDRVDVNRIAIDFIDDSVTPTAELGIASLDASLSGIDNQPGSLFDIEIAIDTRSGGSVDIQGQVGALPSANIDLNVAVEGISLALLHPYLRGLADVNLDSGALGMQVQLQVNGSEELALSGDIGISDFLITETDQGSRLGSWDLLAASEVALSLTNESLDISEITFDQPYGDVLIAEDGSINLGRVAPGEQSATDEDAEGVEPTEEAAEEPLPLAITIGRVLVNNGAADFEDRSLPLPFDVNISDLNGALTTIASASTEPSVAEFEGKVDEFGLVQVSGSVTPLQPALNTDLSVLFENVEMPKFSAYSVPFAGREIASGKLDLSLGYKVEDSELIGENKIVLRDFELGDKVDHPGASSLPLGLAVALLKNPDGTIDIDLPVRGNVDDPEFRYGRVIGKALVNLVVKIAASPFALIGNLVGAEADELEFIAFQDGRADLTPPEQEKAIKLAEALQLRPELTMQVNGVVDREADGLAIRAARVDESVEQQVEANPDDDEQYAAKRLDVLESMYGEGEQRDALEQQFTSEEGLDELAYASALRQQLINNSELDETDYISIARRRASNVQAALLELDPSLQSQISVGELQEVSRDEDEGVRMQIVLSAASDDGE